MRTGASPSRPRGRPSEREGAFGLLMDYREAYPPVRAYLGRRKLAIGKQDPSSWVKRGIELIRAVWCQTQFLSGKGWQRPADLGGILRPATQSMLNPEPDSGLLTATDWQAKLPDDGELTAWLEGLAATPSARPPGLLGLPVVPYRWGLKPGPESAFLQSRAA